MKTKFVALLLFVASGAHANSQTSNEIVASGQKSWKAFQCAALAGKANLGQQYIDAAFNIAFENGEIFLAAFRAGKLPLETQSKWPAALAVKEGEAAFVFGAAFAIAKNEIDEKPNDMKSLLGEFNLQGCAEID
jgi:hypothetical protein